MSAHVMRQYVVYKNPRDVCPWPRGEDVYVVREWFVTLGKSWPGWIIAIDRQLEQVRLDIPANADCRLARSHDDDVAIVEVWI